MVAIPVSVSWVTLNHPSEPYSRKEVVYVGWLRTYSKTSDLEICDEIYRQTNLYKGEFFEDLARFASKDRGHTAISVGDIITVNDNSYECVDFGWKALEKVNS